MDEDWVKPRPKAYAGDDVQGCNTYKDPRGLELLGPKLMKLLLSTWCHDGRPTPTYGFQGLVSCLHERARRRLILCDGRHLY